MKYDEELEDDLNSMDGIMYRLSTLGDATTLDTKDKIVIAEVLQKLPRKIRERILEEVLFIIMRGCWNSNKLSVVLHNGRE